MRTPHRRCRPLVAAVVGTLLLAACAGEADDGEAAAAGSRDDGAVSVVATTSILGDVVEQLVGDDGEVTVLMDPGVDPHAYAPSARDVATVREADLVVANGLQLEEGLLDTLESAEAEGVHVVELAPELDPIGFAEGDDDHADEGDDDHADEDDDHAHGPQDPHVWFDPVRMADGVELLAAELAEAGTGIDETALDRRAGDYVEQLREVHEELEAAFAAVPEQRRVLVTNHEALGYLAHRYDLEVVGTVVPGSSTQAEGDARRFSELVATIEETGTDTIVAETTDSSRLAEQLAAEVGGRHEVEVEVVEVATDALGEPGSPEESYLGLLRTTGTTIAEALA